jgi:hypothetical protein
MWLQSILCTNTHPLLTSMQTFKTQIGELISTMAEVVVRVSIPVTMVHQPLLHVRYVLNQVILLDSAITGLIFLIRISTILETSLKPWLLHVTTLLIISGILILEPPII